MPSPSCGELCRRMVCEPRRDWGFSTEPGRRPPAATAYVQQATRDTNIHVFTYLYGPHNQDAESMMKKIAHEGKGGYNFVTRE